MSQAKEVFAHFRSAFLLAAAMFAFAIGLQLIEQVAAKYGMPMWLLIGMSGVSVCLFIFDAILLVGSVAFICITLLKSLWRNEQ